MVQVKVMSHLPILHAMCLTILLLLQLLQKEQKELDFTFCNDRSNNFINFSALHSNNNNEVSMYLA